MGKAKNFPLLIDLPRKWEKEILFAENAISMPDVYIAYKLCIGTDSP